MNKLIELCPICIESQAIYYTECNHSYCIKCLCKITKCALCRKSLLRPQLCIEITRKMNNTVSIRLDSFPDYQSTRHLLRFMAGMPGLTYSN